MTSEVEAGVHVIAVRGELDLSNASALGECLRSAGGGRVIVDFGACEFIDSTGIALLVAASHEAGERDGTMVLCGLRNQVHRVLEIAGVEEQIATEPSRADALAALAVR